MRLFRGSPLTLKMLQNKPLNDTEQCKADELVEQWRGRLCDISWLMRCLNEHIAKLANAEDKCTGRFWEGRFKSQALLDEQAILTCMTYVDLNPVRAGMAQLPESSDFTAIAQRIKVLARESRAKKVSHKKGANKTVSAPIKLAKFCRPPVKSTMPIIDAVHQGQRATGAIPFYWQDYLELIDWAGRAILPNKTGYIHQSYPAILDRLGIDADDWLDNMPKIESSFHHCIGAEEFCNVCKKNASAVD